jgi:Putative prokaryotic signal transducing protein
VIIQNDTLLARPSSGDIREGHSGPVKDASGTMFRAPRVDMREILKSNNPVLLSFAQALLDNAHIAHEVFDTNMSIMDGSLGILPRRLMVTDEDFARARTLLREGLGEQALDL